MSPPKKKSGAKDLRFEASEWLNQNIAALAALITEQHLSKHPRIRKQYGPRGIQKCQEDAAYHLHYLSEAIAAGSTKIFVDYAGWAKIMLAARGIPARELGENLVEMNKALQSKAERNYRPILAIYFRAVLAALPALPHKVPGFIPAENPFSEIANSYLSSLLVLNREEAISAILQKVDRGLTIPDLFQHIIQPVQQEVGRLWQENQINVVQEHYCTAATESLLTRLRRDFIRRTRQVSALAVCPEREEHCLAIKMFADVLESDGWKVTYAGPKSPTAEVMKYLQSNETDLVAISIATPLNLADTRKMITAIKASRLKRIPHIIVGGGALGSHPLLWKSLRADGSGADLWEGLDVANQLVAQRTTKLST